MGVVTRFLGGIVRTAVDMMTTIALMAPGMALFFAVGIYFLGLTSRILKRRGRLPRTSTLFYTTGTLMAVLTTVFLAVVTSRVSTLSAVAVAPVAMVLPATAAGSLMALVSALLPRRRPTGPRWWWNILLARVIAGLRHVVIPACAVAAVALIVHNYRKPGLTLFTAVERTEAAVMCVGMFAMIAAVARMMIRKAAQRLARDSAPPTATSITDPVLFLRPFHEELRPFRSAVGGTDATFEGFFGAAVTTGLGTLVALGNPNDRIVPSGAVRLYRDADTWRPTVLDLVDRSACILAVSSDTGHTAWELEQVRLRGCLHKLFIVTPPLVQGGSPPVVIAPSRGGHFGAVLGRVVMALFHGSFSRARTAPDPFDESFGGDWEETAAVLRDAGYHPNSSSPGAGAVLAFDEFAEPVVLGRGFSEAEQYVDAVKGRMHPDGAAVAPLR